MFYEYKHFGTSEHFCKEYGENFSFPRHLHHSFELIVVLSGSMEVSVDDFTYSLSCGEALLVFPNQLHSLSGQGSSHMLCIFSPELIRAYSSKVSGKIPVNNKFVVDKYLIGVLDSVSNDASAIEKKGLLYSVCAAFDKNAHYREKSYNDTDVLDKIFAFVEQYYNEDCSLYNLAKQTGYSYSYLSRYFQKNVGYSFNSYVNQYRINKACYLLSNTDYSILQCALECGYTSLRSFNRNFKTFCAVTPQNYRLSAKNG